MARNPEPRRDDEQHDRQRHHRAADPRWDRKQGMPKPHGMAREVERSSSRYSASEQGEERRKRKGEA